VRVTTIYLAGPLFTLAEQEFNQRLADRLAATRADWQIILPQTRAKKLLEQENGIELVFQDCLEMIDRSDVIVGILDGSDADSGTCIELGFAYARRKPIVGIRTDSRALEDRGLNLMVSQVCSTIVLGPHQSTSDLAIRTVQAIDELKDCASTTGMSAVSGRYKHSV
jgi:nucleoside 2-deoxyribosyltransferase